MENKILEILNRHISYTMGGGMDFNKEEAMKELSQLMSKTSVLDKFIEDMTEEDIERVMNPIGLRKELIEVTKMKGCKEEGGFIYDVNPNGTVNPYGNPMKDVNEALDFGYTIWQIKCRDMLYNTRPDSKPVSPDKAIIDKQEELIKHLKAYDWLCDLDQLEKWISKKRKLESKLSALKGIDHK